MKKKKNLKRTLLCISLSLLMVFSMTSCSLQKYNEAINLQKQEMYQEAIEIYTEIEDYKDSKEKIQECKQSQYELAIKYAESNDIENASKLFKSLGNYKDSSEQLKKVAWNYIAKYIEKNHTNTSLPYYAQFNNAYIKGDNISTIVESKFVGYYDNRNSATKNLTLMSYKKLNTFSIIADHYLTLLYYIDTDSIIFNKASQSSIAGTTDITGNIKISEYTGTSIGSVSENDGTFKTPGITFPKNVSRANKDGYIDDINSMLESIIEFLKIEGFQGELTDIGFLNYTGNIE